MAGKFQDTVIVLTGATGTVGQGLARHFASRGAHLVLTARNQEPLETLARSLPPSRAQVKMADLSDANSLRDLEADLETSVPRVDILINNAADVTSRPLMESSLEAIDRQIRTNVIGTLQLCRLLIPHMQGGMKRIVNISSLAGYKPNPMQTVYSISKSGVNAISAALDAELRTQGYHVLNVALMGIGDGPRQIPVAEFAARLERAIDRDQHELFLYRRTQWLMRLYGLFPALARLR